MAEAYFISETTLKNNSYINGNVDNALLMPTLIMVQDIYLQPILGTPLFEDFKTKIDADPTLAAYPTYLALSRDYIKKVLINYMCMYSIDSLRYRLMNKGVMVKNGETSSPADSSELKNLKDEFRNIAEKYSENLTKYLAQNTDTFPLYLETTLTGDNAKKTNYSTGIYLDEL